MATRAGFSVYKRSCAPCAASKRTCDHQQPCSRCVSLGQPEKCIVLPDARRRDARSKTNATMHAPAGAELPAHPAGDSAVPEIVPMGAPAAMLAPTTQAIATSTLPLAPARAHAAEPPAPNQHPDEHQHALPCLFTALPCAENALGGCRKRPRTVATSTAAADAWLLTDGSSVVDTDADLHSERTLTYRNDDAQLLPSSGHSPETRILMRHEDAMVRFMHFQYAQDKILTLCVPGIPLATPLHELKPLADVRGRVPIEHVLSMVGCDDREQRRRRDAYEASVLSFLARLPEPNMRYIFWQPEEVNLAGTDMMAPRLLYGNFAWVFMLFLRRMIPAYMIPMDGSRGVSCELLADALRLFVSLGAPLPATVLTRGVAMPTPQDLLSLGDDALLAMYEDGVFMPRTREGAYAPKNIITPSQRDDYFRAVAQRIANRQRVSNMHVRLEMRGELLISMRPDIRAPFDVEYVMNELPRVRELVQRRPVALELLCTLSGSTWFVVDVDETLSLEFNSVGLLQSVNGTYRNVHFHTVAPSVALAASAVVPAPAWMLRSSEPSEGAAASAILNGVTAPPPAQHATQEIASSFTTGRSDSPFSMVGHVDEDADSFRFAGGPVITIERALTDAYHESTTDSETA